MLRGAWLILALWGVAARSQTIEMAYPDEQGITQGPGHFAFEYLRAGEIVVADSGIQVNWVALPVPRMMKELQSGLKPFCLGGAGVTPERAKIGHYTHPYLNDRMLAVVAMKSNQPLLAQSHDFAELIRQGPQSFIALQGADYGTIVAPQLASLRDRLSLAPRNTEQMLDMLRAGRADFGIVMKSYTANFLAQRGDRDDFVLASYPDMHRDFKVAFLCSTAVPPEVLAALNRSIDRKMPELNRTFPDLRLDDLVN